MAGDAVPQGRAQHKDKIIAIVDSSFCSLGAPLVHGINVPGLGKHKSLSASKQGANLDWFLPELCST